MTDVERHLRAVDTTRPHRTPGIHPRPGRVAAASRVVFVALAISGFHVGRYIGQREAPPTSCAVPSASTPDRLPDGWGLA